MSDFKTLGINRYLVQGLDEMGITEPTEVQEKAIPFLMKEGTDFVCRAQTGTGKTAAFGLPCWNVSTRSPTRYKDSY